MKRGTDAQIAREEPGIDRAEIGPQRLLEVADALGGIGTSAKQPTGT